MFGKTLSMVNFCTLLAACSMLGMTAALPMSRQNPALYQRDLQPDKPAGMVDLMDQYKNLAEQVAASTKGTADYNALVTKMNSTKADLEAKLKGIAVLVDSPEASTSTAVNATVAATPSPLSSVSATSAATTASPPATPASSGFANKVNAVPGPITIVTQIGTSIVVVASQGTTSTVTLATQTSTTLQATSTATGLGSGAASASSTFDINTMPAPDRLSRPQPTATKKP